MSNELEIKKMPASLEAERGILGSMVQDNSCIVNCQSQLVDEDFYSMQYRELYRTIVNMNSNNEAVDLVSLQAKLKTKNVPAELYSVPFLKSLVTESLSTNVMEYCKIVKEKSNLRHIIEAVSNASKECFDGESAESVLEKVTEDLYDIQKSSIKNQTVEIATIAKELLEKMEEASKRKGGIVGVPSGFTYLDKTLSGFQKQNLIILAARTGMGKTSFALNIASHVALSEKRPIAIFSLEMSRVEILARILSIHLQIDSKTIREGSLKDEDWSRTIQELSAMSKSKLIIDDTPAITIAELKAKCRQLKNTRGLDMIIVDYLQLMRYRDKPLENRQQEVAEISRNLKALAKELDIPVMALAQVARSAEQGESKKPRLSNLRESGSIEQDADIVLFIHRPGYYKDDNNQNENQVDGGKDIDEAEIIIAKHRNGETGSVAIGFDPRFTRFYTKETRLTT